MPRAKKIVPQEDVKLINDVFSVKKESQVITKNADGKIIRPSKEIVNVRGYTIKSYMGKTIKHRKAFIPKGQPMVVVATAGMKFEDVPSHLRNRVKWNDSDFI